MDTRFTGVIPPVVTPFKDGEIDFDSLDKVVDFLIDNGMDGLFVGGSSGEVAYLTDEQRDAVAARVIERTAGRVPVLVGAIETTSARVIEQAKRAAALGADAIVATCPFYAINDMAEIEDHFRAVAAATGLPLFAYDVPVRLNGKKLSTEMLVRLGTEGVLTGVKDSSGNDVAFRRLVQLNEKAGHPLVLLTGHECVVDGMLLGGGDGVVPGYGNVEPRAYADLWTAAQAKDWERARRIQDGINEGFEIVFVPQGRSGDATGIGAFKTAMEAQGTIATNEMAFPVKALEGETKEGVVAIVRSRGLI
ncbi:MULTISPECIES: dihydrodipicolinate synthase family protein [unclassified Actinomyces]|uniref:dihydrodipicolinate synthase family protein n=1 Tax=unclassified Actinomyces TaxID=2609248 RepID=UPI002018039B|nr:MULTISPECIES: dihydrodipicolinate synthase family protein [unclassified Actinomyces]MCL3776769.1 dihydrodipicolinate synthase family protein [Actinomyces sp. AC-20-1]MCL3790363.1 dihydrodipicolinate synthase family protein [Actinomyces sp. 187325]MCL3792665.1 dihydrodipicolinate synthase family protein [Actinomyces sp. 186855]MCL3795175.1 dihydrodipicolinate synthase family protein [Actinomyces sp. 217892]